MSNNQGTIEKLAEGFRRFATAQTVASSPLYMQLSLKIADDPTLLAIANYTNWPSQPPPNMLFGAVHSLLLSGVPHPLARFYPSVSGASALTSVEDAYPYFRDFCLSYQDEIISLLQTRLVQTNEVQRCACWLPAFGLVAKLGGEQPLSLVEIGCSAGLNLLWDYYGYDYGDGAKYGDLTSPLQLTCELRGEVRPPFPTSLPSVASRVGLDLNPLDVSNPADIFWLRSLIWPEHQARAATLEKAVRLAQAHHPTLLKGNALALLPAILDDAPPDTTLCLYHSFVLYQFSQAMQEELQDIIIQASHKRPIFVLSMEGRWEQGPLLSLTPFADGVRHTEQPLALCNGHGAWLEWLDSNGTI